MKRAVALANSSVKRWMKLVDSIDKGPTATVICNSKVFDCETSSDPTNEIIPVVEEKQKILQWFVIKKIQWINMKIWKPMHEDLF